jgi:hypothetical protein
MTTRVTIKNEGPKNIHVWRKYASGHEERLNIIQVAETQAFDVWSDAPLSLEEGESASTDRG